ncbi:hypothetical protein [Dactylosporangium matsuzakiense]|uniref:Uncharacterized protein n=1 Tax=Dactylosporangium matsuzakiense TaxID=53360 RepID=A0A9W6KV25_9ACTN|nr:hypothetical protein [Dactylosporangium matsuzakiense]UWZ41777.1 hypothetical protein Dmats_29595 [Dactylosporangium matsuzakiense]GLL06950.1 hypothetical protein GCM10017581_087000 [Dactylosporangium matsuzakiense]
MFMLLGIAVPVLWLLWLVVTDWIPMYPLNDLRRDNLRDRRLAAAVNYPFPLAVAAGVALHRPWSLTFALVLCALTVLGHLHAWWLPYFATPSAAQRERYERDYARTLKLLPTAGHGVVIDVQHMVVGALTLAMAATTVLAAVA